MASKLILVALWLYNALNFLDYPIEWIPSSRTWTFNSNKAQLAPYYFLSLYVLGAVWLLLVICVVITIKVSHGAEIISKDLQILYILGIFDIPLSFGMDFTFYRYGGDLVTFLNWIGVPAKPPKGLDFLGLVLLQMIQSFTLFIGLAVPLLLVYLNLDPTLQIVQMIAKPEVLNIHHFASISSSGIFTGFRYISMLIAMQPVAINFRSVCVALILSFQPLLTHVKGLERRSKCSILQRKHYYKEVSAAVGIIDQLARSALAVYLAIAYFIIIIGANVVLLGIRDSNCLILCIGLFAAGSNGMIVIFILDKTCCLSEYSQKILQSWKNRLLIAGQLRYARCVLASLRPLAFKVGTAGTITRKMKIYFLNSMLTQFINLLVCCNNSIA